MEDSYGDGWNGGYILVTTDGEYFGAYSVSYESGTEQTDSICVAPSTSVEMQYIAGSWEMENTYMLLDGFSNVVNSDGPTPIEGIFYTDTAAEIGDCDDSDATINPLSSEIPTDGIDQNCDGIDE